MLLLLNGTIVDAKLLRFLPCEFAVLEALIYTLTLIFDTRVDLVTSRMFFCKLTAGRVPCTLCLGVHYPRARCQSSYHEIAHRLDHLSLPLAMPCPRRHGILPD